MKHRRFTALFLVPLLTLATACGANQSAQTTESQPQQQTNTQKQQDKSGSDSAKTTVADPPKAIGPRRIPHPPIWTASWIRHG